MIAYPSAERFGWRAIAKVDLNTTNGIEVPVCDEFDCSGCEYSKVKSLISRRARRECKIRFFKRFAKAYGLLFVFMGHRG